MILVASQRGGAKPLAQHLLRTDENEHVELHETRGFVSEDVVGALKEAQGVAKGTRCKQFLFSVSLNPPLDQAVDVDIFENALERIEEANGLSGQPRVVVFHEKEGRRHCHAVWSRIDPETMTARHLPHFKIKLQKIARELYLENDWKMPRGFMSSQEADPRNFTLAEWQQAKRMGCHGRDLKQMFQECWAVSDGRASFAAALKERGFTLAKGDRRGFVGVSHEGEVISIARYVGKKVKEVRAKLGESDDLPSVEESKVLIAQELAPVLREYLDQAAEAVKQEMRPLESARRIMAERQRDQRRALKNEQHERREIEDQVRMARLRRGLAGLWDRLTGKRKVTLHANKLEAMNALQRDRSERHELVTEQLKQRRRLQSDIGALRVQHRETLTEITREIMRLQMEGGEPKPNISKAFYIAHENPKNLRQTFSNAHSGNNPTLRSEVPASKPQNRLKPDIEM